MIGVAERAAPRPTTRPAALVAPIFVGALLRLGWVIVYTRSPFHPLSDSASYLRIAQQFAGLDMPSMGGVHTAFYPPGYSLTLVPVAMLERAGLVSMEFGASLLNVVAGTVTIWLVGVLARQWVGRSAQLPAMWIMALAVAQIAYSAVTMTEIVFTMFAVLCVVAATAVSRREHPRWWHWGGVGLLIGFCFLIRNPAFVLGIVPVGLAYRSRRSWRDAVAAGAAVLVGAAVLLVPWAVRNGVQVGVWTPGGTNVAHLLCLGHRDGANGRFQQNLTETLECTTDSPFDNVALVPLYDGDAPPGFEPAEPDEAAWYRRQFPKAYAWAVANPGREAELAAFKIGELMNGEAVGGAMDAVQGFGTREVVSARTESLVRVLANVWHWAVLAFAALAVAFLPRARAAWPLWLVPLVWTVTSVIGPETDERYFYPSQPFLVVLAVAMLTAIVSAIARERAPTADRRADDDKGQRAPTG